jgi:hypothetical protein
MIRPDIAMMGAKWIGELRLQDRVITIRYVRDLASPGGAPVYGLLVIENLDEGRFSVLIQDPDTWPAGGSRDLSPEAIEEALVHELVHVRWIDLTADKADATSLVQEERATWATARALINAKGSTRAAMVRAMVARKAATRLQTKGKTMDAAAVIAALKEADGEAALQILSDYVAEQLGGTAGPPSGGAVDGMGADAGNGSAEDSKAKPPMNMADEQQRYSRAMKANLDEAARGTAILREDAKRAIVRGMVADGIKLTPHAQKQILDAKTIEDAQSLERLARSMSAVPVEGAKDPKKLAAPLGGKSGTAGLTRSQEAKYSQMSKAGNPRADAYRDECIKATALAKKGGA